MLRETFHFLRHAPEMARLRRGRSKAEFFDAVTARADREGYAAVRHELVGDLTGHVLEIGCGGGSSFEHYGADARVDAVDLDPDSLRLGAAKAERSRACVRVSIADAARLPFADGAFDAVVASFVLCSVDSVEAALGEAFRVLRAGGRLRLLEHVRSEGALAGPAMDWAAPLWLRVAGVGCRWNRDPIPLVRARGFRLEDVRAFQRFDTVLPAFPMRLVRASKPVG